MSERGLSCPFSVGGVAEGPTTTTESTTTTTTPPNPDTHPIADIPSNFNINDHLEARAIPDSSANEPSGNFRIFCAPTHLAHNDPIVFPGLQNSSHLHQFFGNPLVDHTSTYSSLRTSGHSSCEGGPLNRTGYWTPAVILADGRILSPKFILLYYKAQGPGGAFNGGQQLTLQDNQDYISNYNELPNGLRMIAGHPNGHRSWKCESGGPSTSTIPECPDGDDIIAVVDFPSCWDGENLDSADHRSHMAYRNYSNGWGRWECPSTHPVQLPEITEIFYYESLNGEDSSQWSISSDMGAPNGSTLHADWFGAWDNEIQTRWMNGCIREMRNCNNGNLGDGQGLSGFGFGSQANQRLSGYSPMP